MSAHNDCARGLLCYQLAAMAEDDWLSTEAIDTYFALLERACSAHPAWQVYNILDHGKSDWQPRASI